MLQTNTNKEQFSYLLKQAVDAMSHQTGKRISVIKQSLADKIGRKVSTIEYWERLDNFTLPKRAELQGLADIIFRHLHDEQWLDAFLLAGEHPAAEAYRNCLLRKHGHVRPHQRAGIFVGRIQQLKMIYAELERPNGNVIVAIDGLGGIGKTAVAAKVHDYYANAVFDQVIWISADRSELPFDLREQHPFSYDMILNNIGLHLGEQGIKKMSPDQKAKRIFTLLQSRRCLIILDNLDTAVLPQHEIVAWLRPFLGHSRALITSRRRLSGDVFSVHLPSLQRQCAHELLQQLGQNKLAGNGVQTVPSTFDAIYNATGGSPLAIKLVVDLLAHLPLTAVLRHLTAVSPIDRLAAEDDYIQFYRHLFLQFWMLLSAEDEQLLQTIARVGHPDGISIEILEKTNSLSSDQIATVIQHLWRLSLIEVHEQPHSNGPRYFLHPLTRYFVQSRHDSFL